MVDGGLGVEMNIDVELDIICNILDIGYWILDIGH